jgi:hypothetical protein
MEDKLVQNAIDAIKAIVKDTSVDRLTTKDRLVQVQEELDILLDTL